MHTHETRRFARGGPNSTLMYSVLLHPWLLKKVFGELQVPRARCLWGAPRLCRVLRNFRNEQPPTNHCKLKR
eukprot:2631894-Pyramimonas_sp.AAC.1